nr:PREDICTED: uncharacterized protein LOC106706040 isoform X1 [Latimeria chalumnae]|eukprot:XP_014351894.1 PREDICTED: uncharacterized protein LOC106706040 isoform X1 [Latimeria chalumnae]
MAPNDHTGWEKKGSAGGCEAPGDYSLSEMEIAADLKRDDIIQQFRRNIGWEEEETFHEKLKNKSMKRHFSLAAQDAYKIYSNRKLQNYLSNEKCFPFDFALDVLFRSQQEQTGDGKTTGSDDIGDTENSLSDNLSGEASGSLQLDTSTSECEKSSKTEPASTSDHIDTQINTESSMEEVRSMPQLSQAANKMRVYKRGLKSTAVSVETQINTEYSMEEARSMPQLSQAANKMKINKRGPKSTAVSVETQINTESSMEEATSMPQLSQAANKMKINKRGTKSADHSSGVEREIGRFFTSSQDSSVAPSFSSREQEGTQKAETQEDGEGQSVPSQISRAPKAASRQKGKAANIEKQKALQCTLEDWLRTKISADSITDEEIKKRRQDLDFEIINQAEHRDYKCLKVYDCLVVQNPVDKTRGILDIRLPKDFKSVDGDEVFEATAEQFSGILTAKGALCSEYVWQMCYNMAILNHSRTLKMGNPRKVSWAECFLFRMENPLKRVKYDEGKFSSFTLCFNSCVEEIFLPVIALYKEMQKEDYTGLVPTE